MPFDRAGRRGAARTPGWWPARTSPGSTARSSTPRRCATPACRSCSTARRASARCRSTCARWAATTTPPPARSGCAGRTAAATCTCARDAIEELAPAVPGYGSLADPLRRSSCACRGRRALRRRPAADPPHGLGAGRARRARAAGLRRGARARGRAGRAPGRRAGRARARRSPRAGASTLVSWEAADPEADVERLADAGIVVRNLPGTPYVRASVGAWTTEDELERLAAAPDGLVLRGHHDRRRTRSLASTAAQRQRHQHPVADGQRRRGPSRRASTARAAPKIASANAAVTPSRRAARSRSRRAARPSRRSVGEQAHLSPPPP